MRRIQVEGELEWSETPVGRYWVPRGDNLAGSEVLAEQSPNEYRAKDRGVRQGDVVLDRGGSSGVFTRWVLRQGASRLVSIELAPWALECLWRNLWDEIQAGRGILYPKSVWDREATLLLNVPAGRSTTAASVTLN